MVVVTGRDTRTLDPEVVQDLRYALDEAVSLPEHAVAVEEPGVVLLDETGVIRRGCETSRHREVLASVYGAPEATELQGMRDGQRGWSLQDERSE